MQKNFSFRLVIWLAAIISFSSCMNRPFPKRLTGAYVGSQDHYNVNINNKTIKIPETTLRVELQYDHLLIKSEQQKNIINYTIGEKTDQYYPLTLTFEDGIIEHWELYPKDKKLVRTEQVPRPSITFLKE